ncbi:MAG TPA: sensory rhodopsin transducer [Ohtaekwangia sp.]|nr:sensory rhodopsin transducer [Ohtaekwangia sp.]
MRNTDQERSKPAEKFETRKDLQDGSKGKDLSYLNELPQMGGYEGVKAGVPPPRNETTDLAAAAETSSLVERIGTRPVGHTVWAVAEGYIPSRSNGPEPEMTSHETVCILNVNEQVAHIGITVYFSDKDPVGPYRIVVPARRTKHIKLNDLDDPSPIPRDTDYAFLVESDLPVVVQHTRLDSRQAENALLSTMAFPVA